MDLTKAVSIYNKKSHNNVNRVYILINTTAQKNL